MKAITIPTYLNIDLNFETVSLGRRFGGFALDWLIKWAYVLLVSSGVNISLFGESLLVPFIIYSPFIFYSFLFEWLNKGQTLGKMAAKSRVIGMDGNLPSVSQCATRWMFNSVDVWLVYLFLFVHPKLIGFSFISPFIGAAVIAMSPKNQRLGDMAAKTLVVSTKESIVSIFDTIYAYASFHKNYVPKYPEIMRLPDKDITLIKALMEQADDTFNDNLAQKLALHIKKVLNIQTKENDAVFLRHLLEDYNYYSLKA